MNKNKHKRKTNHFVIVTSDSVDADVKQFRIKPKVLYTLIIVLCALLGAMIGYLVYEEKIWETAIQRNSSLSDTVNELMAEKEELLTQAEKTETELSAEIAELNEQIKILSETVNQKVEREKELTILLEKQSLPTEFPLTGSTTMEEAMDGELPICLFTAAEGAAVVATANGTITAINDDVEYGHNIWIDHGNGYVTIYRNKGTPTVKTGDMVVQGSMLFLIKEDNGKLGYQIMKDGYYVNPMDVLDISG